MRISLLDDRQLRELHGASIRILETIGIQLPHLDTLNRFAEAGARVDFSNRRVQIPEELVDDGMKMAGKSFTLYGRDRSKKAEFGAGKRNYNSSAGQALWIDDNLTRRYAALEDVRTASRLADGLPSINIVGAMADPHELPVSCRCVFVAAEQLKHTTKPITFWFHDRASARFLVELFTLVSGSEEQAARYPMAYPLFEPISPLRFPECGVDLLYETCRLRLPVPIGPMAQVGATAVGTLAGTMAQQNAEILAGICIVQLIGPGTPVCYGAIPHAFDMRTTRVVFGGPEQALMAVGLAELGKSYGLPVYINVGLTDSKFLDAQAGLEIAVTLACGAMAGADIFGHFGISGADQGASPAMLLLQHEIIGYVERLLRGIEMDDERFGLEVIEEGIKMGSFLGLEHTVRHFRDELWFPRLLDRRSWDAWAAEGCQDMAARCAAMKNRVLQEHAPEPMDEQTQKDIDRLLNDAMRHLGSGPYCSSKAKNA